MKRYCLKIGDYVESPEVDAFLQEIVSVCEKHGMSLGTDGYAHVAVESLNAVSIRLIKEAEDLRS